MGEFTLLDKIKIWFRQLFCRHNYLADYLPMQLDDWLICDKCGKAKKISLLK